MMNKMELTPDKDYVWGKLVVQGVSECLRDKFRVPTVGPWQEKGGISSPKLGGRPLFSPVSLVLIE